MESLALRLVLPPLVVLIASLTQRRLGDRLGGVLVGLPLTSGTFLTLVLHAQGPATVAEAAVGMLAGQVAVLAMVASYVRSTGAGILAGLLRAIAGWGIVVLSVRSIDGLFTGLALFVAAAVLTLRTWPSPAAPEVSSQPASEAGEFTIRIVLASALVVTLTGAVHALGPHLVGLLSAAPLIALVLTPATHNERGTAAAGALLHGVARGSVGAAAFALVLALTVEPLGGIAFLAASSSGIAVAGLVSLMDRPSRPVVLDSSDPGTQLVPNSSKVLHE